MCEVPLDVAGEVRAYGVTFLAEKAGPLTLEPYP